MLLVYGANPNQQDHEQSTPLHALSWPNLCDCVSGWSYCDTKQPVDELVKMLVNYGANIEARNSCGDTPLQLAVSRFDVELTKALLKYGASLDSLNKDKMFSMNFSSLELKCYAFTLNIIDVMQLLRSSGYEMDLLSRLRMIKCWLNVRGNYTDYMICNDTATTAGLLIRPTARCRRNTFHSRPARPDRVSRGGSDLSPSWAHCWWSENNFNCLVKMGETKGSFYLNETKLTRKLFPKDDEDDKEDSEKDDAEEAIRSTKFCKIHRVRDIVRFVENLIETKYLRDERSRRSGAYDCP
ncbi:unnamed protein product [Trichogramma brassicae]|uniref:Uncharacterized protein n=1 Tax=Trichogramma brassicae TaxID=86971 RepID=A0A6H5IS28_9HYME|nr:unnamed protein product [Trichogramma brassicae]